MKRWLIILSVICLVAPVLGDDYVDDIYYSPEPQSIDTVSPTPYYNTRAMRELIFIEDSIPISQADSTSQSIPQK